MVKLCPALRVRPAPWHSPPYRVPAFASIPTERATRALPVGASFFPQKPEDSCLKSCFRTLKEALPCRLCLSFRKC